MVAAPIPQIDRVRSMDELLDQICLSLQISSTQFEQAKQRYEAVGKWLKEDGSRIARLSPLI